MAEPYRVPGYSQMDGSVFGKSNCVLAVTTNLIDRATVGALRIPASTLRTITGDTSGGILHSQAAAAALKATNGRVVLTPRVLSSRQQLRDLSQAGIAFGLFMHTAETRYTRFRTNYYIGLHELYVQDYDAAAYSFLIEDPGTTSAGYMWWPESLVFRAAERAGNGSIFVLTARDTEGVARKAVASGFFRAKPDLTSAHTGTLVAGKSYHVIRTVNGAMWKRADGGQSNGYHQTSLGYAMGRRLA